MHLVENYSGGGGVIEKIFFEEFALVVLRYESVGIMIFVVFVRVQFEVSLVFRFKHNQTPEVGYFERIWPSIIF
ncbi:MULTISPECIES: hypothetical protein [unclassified Sphingobacterium]|uniref:hypothetical protein n=1 Tax=unclassified Sphingobacterium TaxID=2609468 RepID=UPI001043D45B|nr:MULTISPECIES: hypothetical protein [unclassified Sphingobacterium]MCS3556580.1 hypothetical protein [Sphingobacterium sp. JUb21]TCQ99874.1 hypothetical protein EDF66_11399 [Sphingobacterium sp. JUb20]